MVVPGCSSRTTALRRAIRRFLLTSKPSPVTRPLRSTSVSKITPKSAPLSLTAFWMAAMAAASSGLGMWLGKFPSGSRKTEPVVSAPSCSSTCEAKNPPAPLPASTTIFMPSRGRAFPGAAARTLATRPGAYTRFMKSMALTAPGVGASGAPPAAASASTSAIWDLFREPSAVNILRPLRLKGRWEAVTMMPASMGQSRPGASAKVEVNMAGVEERPVWYTCTPAAVRPDVIDPTIHSAVRRESCPMATLNSSLARDSVLSHAAKALPMSCMFSGLMVTGSPSTPSMATPRMSLPFWSFLSPSSDTSSASWAAEHRIGRGTCLWT
mmetsp:Transcript_7067/g.24524  ORF Transcript_7067/g.24524 Transcript_7067/m.24524 type:complete len:325 (-) Transcript_7067:263-1237(-)